MCGTRENTFSDLPKAGLPHNKTRTGFFDQNIFGTRLKLRVPDFNICETFSLHNRLRSGRILGRNRDLRVALAGI